MAMSSRTSYYPRPEFITVTTNTVRMSPVVASDATQRVVWPEEVREYVRRNFAQENWTQLGISRELYEARLKAVISDAQKRNELLITDWKNMPSVYQFIMNERNPLIGELAGPRKRKSDQIVVDSASPEAQASVHTKLSTSYPDGPSPRNGSPLASMVTLNSLQDRIKQSKSDERAEKRQKRNHKIVKPSYDNARNVSSSGTPSRSASEPPGPVVGRSTQLERRYLRLTAAPDPEMVRPLPILKQTLQLLKSKWTSENDYSYICEQFKSLRQDLTVQHIKNDFTTSVYEVHARIALERGDLGEFNQCQTQLKILYGLGLGGKPAEFKAYRILYTIHTNNMMNMNDILASLSTTEKSDPAIRHALKVRAARAGGNYHQFFRLYHNAPNMNAYLMDMSIVRERLGAMAAITRSYNNVQLRFVTEELGFESDSETVEFLKDQQADDLLEHRGEQFMIDCRRGRALFAVAKQAALRRIDIKGQI